MAEITKIQWCDHTFNPWRGCTKVHAGCANCYAEATSKRNPSVLGMWGPNGTRVVASESQWREPVKWNRQAERDGVRRRVFCASLADVFEDWQGPVVDSDGDVWRVCDLCDAMQPDSYMCVRCNRATPAHDGTLNDIRGRLFRLIDATPNLDWLLLTKRPENVWRMWPLTDGTNEPVSIHSMSQRRDNVWIGTSVSDQATADKYVPELLKLRDLSPVLFLSVEPLLGPIQIKTYRDDLPDWIIVGGESGPHARPCDVGWIRSIVEQCRVLSVPCFVKQLGANIVASDGIDPIDQFPGDPPFAQGRSSSEVFLTLEDSKGGDPAEWPADCRVREFPERGE